MSELTIEELAYYIESPSVVLETGRTDSSVFKFPSDKFVQTMRIHRVNVATPQDGPHPYTYHMEPVRETSLPEGSFREQVESCLATYPKGSRVHIRIAGASVYIEYLYPKIRTVCRKTNSHGQYVNSIELVLPRAQACEKKTKVFGGLQVRIENRRVGIGWGGLLRSKNNLTAYADFDFLDDDASDTDIKRALAYLKLLGAEASEENFVVGIDVNYNRKTLDFIRRVKRIMDAI